MNTTLWVLLGLAAAVFVYVVYAYNRLIRKRNRVQEAWADIDVQLKRRSNLVPNLVNTVKGYATHEKGVFEEVTKARSQAMQAGTTEEKAQGENMLSDALKSLFAVAENYPDLKAADNFKELQRELSDTENKIQSARRFYNTNVRDYNTAIETFPINMIAGTFNFDRAELFKVEIEEERNVPNVEF